MITVLLYIMVDVNFSETYFRMLNRLLSRSEVSEIKEITLKLTEPLYKPFLLPWNHCACVKWLELCIL